MARCDYCNTTILFGGKTEGNLRFCNDSCYEKGQLKRVSLRIPQREVDGAIEDVHGGRCPKCNGKGPVDVHVAHSVWSAVYLTSWNSTPEISCRSCGVKRQVSGLLFSGALGWWGFPWGLIMTPVQICRNLGGIFGGPNPEEPSAELEKLVRLALAAGDIPSSGSGRKRRSRVDDDELVDDAFEEDAFDDDDDYDEVEVVTTEKPKRRSGSEPTSNPRSKQKLEARDDGRSSARSSPQRVAATPSTTDARVTCPSCNASFKATAAVLGKRVKCPKCAGVINVPNE